MNGQTTEKKAPDTSATQAKPSNGQAKAAEPQDNLQWFHQNLLQAAEQGKIQPGISDDYEIFQEYFKDPQWRNQFHRYLLLEQVDGNIRGVPRDPKKFLEEYAPAEEREKYPLGIDPFEPFMSPMVAKKSDDAARKSTREMSLLDQPGMDEELIELMRSGEQLEEQAIERLGESGRGLREHLSMVDRQRRSLIMEMDLTGREIDEDEQEYIDQLSQTHENLSEQLYGAYSALQDQLDRVNKAKNDLRVDEELPGYAGEGTYARIPEENQQDWQALDERAKLIKEKISGLKPKGADMIRHRVNTFLQTYSGQFPAGILEGTALLQKNLTNYLAVVGNPANHQPSGFAARTVYNLLGGDETRLKEAEQLAAWQYAQDIKEVAGDVFPTDAVAREDFISELIAGTASFGAFATSGVIANTILPGSGFLTAVGAATTSGMGQTYAEAKQMGASEEEAMLAGNWGSIGGAIQVIPVLRLLQRFDKASGGQLRRGVRELAKEGFVGGLEEAFAEMAGQTWFDQVARNIYDEERELLHSMKMIGKAGAVGGTAGFIANVIFGAIGRGVSAGRVPGRLSDQDVSRETTPEGEPAPERTEVDLTGESEQQEVTFSWDPDASPAQQVQQLDAEASRIRAERDQAAEEGVDTSDYDLALERLGETRAEIAGQMEGEQLSELSSDFAEVDRLIDEAEQLDIGGKAGVEGEEQVTPESESREEIESRVERFITERAREKDDPDHSQRLKRVSEDIREGRLPDDITPEMIEQVLPSTLDRETGETHQPGDPQWPRTGTLMDFMEMREQQRTPDPSDVEAEEGLSPQEMNELKQELSQPAGTSPDQAIQVVDDRYSMYQDESGELHLMREGKEVGKSSSYFRPAEAEFIAKKWSTQPRRPAEQAYSPEIMESTQGDFPSMVDAEGEHLLDFHEAIQMRIDQGQDTEVRGEAENAVLDVVRGRPFTDDQIKEFFPDEWEQNPVLRLNTAKESSYSPDEVASDVNREWGTDLSDRDVVDLWIRYHSGEVKTRGFTDPLTESLAEKASDLAGREYTPEFHRRLADTLDQMDTGADRQTLNQADDILAREDVDTDSWFDSEGNLNYNQALTELNELAQRDPEYEAYAGAGLSPQAIQELQNAHQESIEQQTEPTPAPASQEQAPADSPATGQTEGVSFARRQLESRLEQAQNEYQEARTAFETKRRDLDQAIADDSPDLFGERAADTEQRLFDDRVDIAQRDPALRPFAERLRQARSEVNRLRSELESLDDSPDPSLFDQQTQQATEEASQELTQPTDPQWGSDNKLFTKDRYEQARQAMMRKLGELRTGLDPEMLRLSIEIGGYHLEAGARSFGRFAGRMVSDLGEGIRPYLKSIYNSLRDWPGIDSEGMTSPEEVARIDVEQIGPGQQAPNIPTKAQLEAAISSGNKDKSDYIVRRLHDIRDHPEFTKAIEHIAEHDVHDVRLANRESDKLLRDLRKELGDKSGLREAFNLVKKDQIPDLMVGPLTAKITTQMFRQGMISEAVKVNEFKDESSRGSARRQRSIRADASPEETVSRILAGLATKKSKALQAEAKDGKSWEDLVKQIKATLQDMKRTVPEEEFVQQARDYVFRALKTRDVETQAQIEARRKAAEEIVDGFQDNQVIDRLSEHLAELVDFDALDGEKVDKIIDMTEELGQLNAEGKKELAYEKWQEIMIYLKDEGLLNRSWQELFKDLWYTAVMSGLTTHARSQKGSTMTSAIFYTFRLLSNPEAAPLMVSQFAKGLKGGAGTYAHVLKTGKTTINWGDFNPTLPRYTVEMLNKQMSELNVTDQMIKTFLASPTYMYNSILGWDQVLKDAGSEMNQAVMAYTKAKESSSSRAEALIKAKKMLAVDQEADAAAQAKQEVEQMEAEGKPVTPGYQQRRTREILNDVREGTQVKRAFQDAGRAALVDDPIGILGRVYSWASMKAEKDLRDHWSVLFGRLMSFPFMRVNFNYARFGMSFTPAGYVMGAQKSVWTKDGVRPVDKFERNEYFARASAGMAVYWGVFLSMFDFDLEEGINIKDKDNRWIDITGNLTGKWWEQEDTGAQPWSVSVRNPFTGNWSGYYSYIDNPIGFMLAPMGILRDQFVHKDFQQQSSSRADERRQSHRGAKYLFSTGVHGVFRYAMDQSFNQGMNNIHRLMSETDAEDWNERVFNVFGRPVQALYPNLYNQMYSQYRALMDIPERDANGFFENMYKKVPILDNLVRDHRHDLFGYPVIRDFDVPLVPDYLLKQAKDNLDYREGIPEWQLLQKYEQVVVGNFYPPVTYQGQRLDESTRQEYQKQAGLEMRRHVSQRYNYLDSLDPEDLQRELLSIKSRARRHAKRQVIEIPFLKQERGGGDE